MIETKDEPLMDTSGQDIHSPRSPWGYESPTGISQQHELEIHSFPSQGSHPPLCLMTEENFPAEENFSSSSTFDEAYSNKLSQYRKMGTRPKKKDFFNRGRGVDYSEYSSDPDGSLSPFTTKLDPSPPPNQLSYQAQSHPYDFATESKSPLPLYDMSSSSHEIFSPASPNCNPDLTSGLEGFPFSRIAKPMNVAETTFFFPEEYSNNTQFPHSSQRSVFLCPDDGTDFAGSAAVDGASGQQANAKRRQKCSMCFNHGVIAEKKGHKGSCPYDACDCARCLITKGRQKTMKEQQKLTRNLEKMRLKLLKEK